MTFKEWMNEANRECARLLMGGLDLLDLPDRPYRDMYEDGMSPTEAAKDAIEYAGGGDLL